MPKKQPQIAKLTRPRLQCVVVRERLFALLDRARGRRLVWVGGPPGAGKTTLVATWLDSRKTAALWYEVDAGDRDLATFFHYLRQAATMLSARGEGLPVLTREHPRDVTIFARRFFRELFEAAPGGTVLVLDNFQEAGPGSPLSKLLAVVTEEVPAGATIVAISRTDCPQNCARLAASESMSTVDAEDLRFTLEETRSFLASRGAHHPDLVAHLQHLSEGWPAGMTLMLESLKYHDAVAEGPQSSARDAIFAYFADQVFDKASTPLRKLLLRTALFPRFTVAMAEAVSGIDDPGRILDQLCRRRLFVNRRTTQPPTYQYHALFGQFLRTRLSEALSGTRLHRLHLQTADLLTAAGDVHEAFGLYCAARQWDAAQRLLKHEAETLLDQGRWRTVLDWVDALPSERGTHDTWLQYWRGMALISVDLGTARWALENACNEFARTNERVGVCLAAAGLLDRCFYEYSDFRQGDTWLELLCTTLPHVAHFPTPSSELEAYSAALMGLLFRRPGDALLSRCIERIEALREQKLNANRLLMTDLYLITYASFAADLVRARRLAVRIAELVSEPDVSALNRYHAFDWLAYLAMVRGDYREATSLLDNARAVSEESGQISLEVDLLLTEIYTAVQRDAPKEAGPLLDRMETMASASRPIDRLFYLLARTRVRSAHGDLKGAIQAGQDAISAADAVGVTAWQAIARVWTACANTEYGDYKESSRLIAEGKDFVRGTCLIQSAIFLDVLAVVIDLRQENREDARRELTRLLSFVRQRECGEILCRVHQLMPDLCAEALAADIEAPYVRNLIRRFGWPAPSQDFDAWPWPIRIRTFGRFSIELDGEPLEFSGKAPRKVLALLKALIALGGERVPRQQVIDALWSDNDGDSAEAALDVAVVRLRKLLNRQDAIAVSNELLSINRRCCWVDCFAFEQLDSTKSDSVECLDRQLAMYRGDFLPEERDAAWSVRPRLRLRTLFCRRVTETAALLESRGAWRDAIRLYSKGMETDDLMEEFYQGLMRCHLALGSSAEGMGVFRRLRQTLSVLLGVAPSSISEALARDLQSARPAFLPRD